MVKFGLALFSNEPIDRIISLAKEAEERGFEYVWIPDEKFYRDPYSTLTGCALNTRRVNIGVGVTDPYSRHPVYTAANISTVNEISNGRAILGIGAGGGGFKPLGITRREPEMTIREAVQVIRSLMRGEVVDCKLKTITVRGAKLGFHAAYVPIFIGSYGPRVLQLAGEIADGALIGSGGGASPAYLRFALEMIERGAQKSGRDARSVERVAWIHTAISHDRGRALELVKPIVAVSLWNSRAVMQKLPFDVKKDVVGRAIETMEKEFTTGIEPSDSAALKKMIELIPDDLASELSVAGTISDCLAKVEQIARTGVQQISVLFAGVGEERRRSFELFASKILPSFK